MAKVIHEAILAKLVELFNWSDPSDTHALLHVENAVINLRTDLSVAEKERDALRAELDELKRLLPDCEHFPSSKLLVENQQLRERVNRLEAQLAGEKS